MPIQLMLREIKRAWPVALATGARLLFGAALAAAVVARLPSDEAVRFFQLLFAQSIFITFASGSGYGHVLAVVAEGNCGSVVRRYLKFAAATTFAAVGAVWCAPSFVLDRFLTADFGQISTVILGGTAMALHGVLQGVVQSRRGLWRAFAPITITSVIAAVILAMPFLIARIGLLQVFFAYQAVSLIIFCVLNSSVIIEAINHDQKVADRPFAWLQEMSVYGIVNTLSVLVIYLFREYWARRVSADISKVAFFLFRLSDLYLGVLAVLLAGSALMPLVRAGPPRRRRSELLLAAGGLILAIGAALYFVAGLSWSLLMIAILLQALVEVVRLLSTVTSLAELQNSRPRRYAAVVLPGPALGAAAGALLTQSEPLLAIYACYAVSAGVQMFSYLVAQGTADARAMYHPR